MTSRELLLRRPSAAAWSRAAVVVAVAFALGASPVGAVAATPAATQVTVADVQIGPATVLERAATPPITVPPITVPPITVPPITVPPITVPPITVPPITVPPVTATAPLTVGSGGMSVIRDQAYWWVDGHRSDPRAATISDRIASKPAAQWLTGYESENNLRQMVAQARANDETMVLALYNHPELDDGLGNSHDAPNPAQYRAWIDWVSGIIGSTRAIVVVEPDGLWFADRLGGDPAYTTRIEAIRYAVQTLGQRNANTEVYIEAGTSSRSVTPQRMAQLLVAAGLRDARGFAVNVSSFSPEAAITDYAGQIRTALQREHGIADPRYVVDTSRNGTASWPAPYEWCNPAGRSLGAAPAVLNAASGRDANLWVKFPGSSDGSCGTAVGTWGGQWTPEQAVALIR